LWDWFSIFTWEKSSSTCLFFNHIELLSSNSWHLSFQTWSLHLIVDFSHIFIISLSCSTWGFVVILEANTIKRKKLLSLAFKICFQQSKFLNVCTNK
jgi:hypothetical protein